MKDAAAEDTIFPTIGAAVTLARHINALRAEVSTQLLRTLGIDFEISDKSVRYVTSPYTLIWPQFADRFVLKPRGAEYKRPINQIEMWFDLWRDEGGMLQSRNSAGPGRSLVYVCASDDQHPWEIEELAFTSNGEPRLVADGKLALLANRLWVWVENEEPNGPLPERPWFYCVPLQSINDGDAVTRLLVEPVDRIFKGAPAEDAIGHLSDVVEFRHTK